MWLKLLWVGHAIICTILDTLFCATPDSMFIVEMFVLRRRLAEEDPSSNEAETLGWQLVRLFVHWRCIVDRRRLRPGVNPPETIGWRLARLFVRWRLFVEMCVRRRHLANQPSIEAVALYWRASRQDIRLRWLAETSQLRLTAVARVVLLQRRLDAATIKHVLSYLR